MTKLVIAAVGGLVGLIFMLVHPVGPVLALLIISPFDALFFRAFGFVGNFVTYVPIGVLMLRMSPAQWPEMLFGTRIQTTIIILFLLLTISHAIALPTVGPMIGIEYGRKFTLLFLVGMFAWSLRDSRYITTVVRFMVLAMTVYTALSMLGFFLHINILPSYKQETAIEAATIAGEEFARYKVKDWRFTGANLSVNRYGNWMLLPTVLAMGWAAHRSLTRRSRLLALGCVAILATGMMATLSRTAVGSLMVSVALILVLVYRLRPLQVFGFLLMAAIVGGAGWTFAKSYSIDEAIAVRFAPEDITASAGGRLQRVFSGFKLFATSPLVGVGDSLFKLKNVYQTQGQSAHNAFMAILAETGVVGFVPWMLLLFLVFQRLRSRHSHLPPEYEWWRPYFLSALVGLVLSMFFHGYAYERWVWFTFAYAAALERASTAVLRARQEGALDDPEAPGEPMPDAQDLGWLAHSGLPGDPR